MFNSVCATDGIFCELSSNFLEYVSFILFQLSLGWLYLFMGILIGSAVIPIVLCMFWERLTGVGMIAGSITGSSLALVAWLVTASFEEHGLTNFMDNTGMIINVY